MNAEEREELHVTAIHEAEHFVMGAIVGGAPRLVTVAPTTAALGSVTRGLEIPATFGSVMSNALILFAGRLAVDVYTDEGGECGAMDDEDVIAEQLARLSAPDPAYYEAEHMAARLICYKRVGAAIRQVAAWLEETISPSEEQTSEMYVTVARRIGFLRFRAWGWIAEWGKANGYEMATLLRLD